MPPAQTPSASYVSSNPKNEKGARRPWRILLPGLPEVQIQDKHNIGPPPGQYQPFTGAARPVLRPRTSTPRNLPPSHPGITPVHTPPPIHSALLGMMLGDSIGLPFEGLHAPRIHALIRDRPLRHALLFRRGMVSDDTEHAVITRSAFRDANNDPALFSRSLARRLRLWFLCIPAATGLATARACLKLLLGINPERSGVFSAGNGPLMRALPLGALCTSDDQLREFVRRSTIITHTDPRALHAALAIALAARAASSPNPADTLSAQLPLFLPDGPVLLAAQSAIAAARANTSPSDFAASISCPRAFSGYVLHTLPAVLFFWLSSPLNPRAAIESAIRRGGDTDTIAALVGGLSALSSGPQSLPQDWLNGIVDFPLNPHALTILESRNLPASRWLALPFRNLFFLLVVLAHAARRLLPPYA